jgi:hypothetical protein
VSSLLGAAGAMGGCARAGDVPDGESGRGGGRCFHRACTQQGSRGVLQSGGDLLKVRRPGGAMTGRGRVWPEGGAANRGGRGGVLRRPGEAAAVAGQRAAVGSASSREHPSGGGLARPRLAPGGLGAVEVAAGEREQGAGGGCAGAGARGTGGAAGREGEERPAQGAPAAGEEGPGGGGAGGRGPAAAGQGAGGGREKPLAAGQGEDLNLNQS